MEGSIEESKSSHSENKKILKLMLDCIPRTSAEWVRTFKKEAILKVIQKGFPSSREESWRYTKFEPNNFQALLPSKSFKYNGDAKSHETYDGYNIFLHDKKIQCQDEHFLSLKNIRALFLSEVFSDTSMQIPELRTTSSAEEFDQSFIVLLNSAFCEKGIVINICDNTKIEKPVNIYYFDDGLGESQYSQTIINIGSNSEIKIYEWFISDNNTSVTYNHVVRMCLGANSKVDHYRTQEFAANYNYYSATHLYLNKGSNYNGVTLDIGAKKSRNEIHADIFDHACCKVNGASLGHRQQHYDTYLNFKHRARNSLSSQLLRQILDDRACGIFYGKINIPGDCPKVQAQQLHRILLLSEKAKGFSRPELQIFTDDVQCSHGSTIGSMSNDVLYYLRTRGLDKNQAINLLLEGFFVTMLESIECNYSRTLIHKKLISWIQKKML